MKRSQEARLQALEAQLLMETIAAEEGIPVEELRAEAHAILRFIDKHGRWPTDEEDCP